MHIHARTLIEGTGQVALREGVKVRVVVVGLVGGHEELVGGPPQGWCFEPDTVCVVKGRYGHGPGRDHEDRPG